MKKNEENTATPYDCISQQPSMFPTPPQYQPASTEFQQLLTLQEQDPYRQLQE